MKTIIHLFIINLLYILIVKADIIYIPADYLTIQAGIDSSMNGDTVLVADGVYFENINFNGKAITVASNFLVNSDTSHISNTIIDGSQPVSQHRASTVTFSSGEDTTSILYGFTVTGGTGTFIPNYNRIGGGGIFIYYSGCKIQYNKIKNNSLTFFAGYGIVGVGIASLIDSTNYVIIENNIICSNTGNGFDAIGGGIFLRGNHYGSYNGYCRIINNLIFNNSVSADWDSYGGGISSYITNLICINNTVVDNYAQKYAGGMDIYASNASIINTIVWNNSSNDNQQIVDELNNLKIMYSNVQDGWIGTGNMNSDPVFIYANQNDYRLQEHSPCIGKGIDMVQINGQNLQAPSIDLYGNIRPFPQGSKPDIGALESSLAVSDSIYNIPSYFNPVNDTLVINAFLQNPSNHIFEVKMFINSIDTVFMDSVYLFDDGNHNDGQPGDEIWGGYLYPLNIENEFIADLQLYDTNLGRTFIWDDFDRFTTIGPIAFEEYLITSTDTIPNHGDRLKFKLILKNSGFNSAALSITSNLISLDTCSIITPVLSDPKYYDINPGERVTGSRNQFIEFPLNCPDSIHVYFKIDISSNGYLFWTDTFSIFVHKDPTGIKVKDNDIPKEFTLKQNYPNPFNPSTTIEFLIPKTEFVTLKIYNLLGQVVARLVSEKLTPGVYKYEWDASGFASGVYLYKLEMDGGFMETKKLILLK